jgi:hypothetical protein
MNYARPAGAIQHLLAIFIELLEVQVTMGIYCTGN